MKVRGVLGPDEGDCKEIVWENCELRKVPAEFKVTKTICLPDGDVCYTDCKPTKGTRMVDHMDCKAKVGLNANCIKPTFLLLIIKYV